MSDLWNIYSRLLDRFVDFAVLSVTFFISCGLFSVESGADLYVLMATYPAIVLVSIRLSKRVISGYSKLSGSSTRQILGNAIGIFVGTCIVLLLQQSLAVNGPVFASIVFSSFMSFFVLGTLSPIMYRSTTVHK